MNNQLKIEGTYEVSIKDVDGTLLSYKKVKNIVTNAGIAQLALLAIDPTAIPFTYIALGTSNTAVSATDTTLTAEITDTGLSRVAGSVSRITGTVTNDTLQISTTFTATGSKTVQEGGIFNASTGGVMLSHGLLGANVLTNGQSFGVVYTLKLSR